MKNRGRRARRQKSKRERAESVDRILEEGGKCSLGDGITLEVKSIEDKTLLEVLEELDWPA